MIQNLSRETKLFIAASAAQVVGFMGPSLVPFMTGLGVDVRGMSFMGVGSLFTVSFLSRGAGAILVVPLINFVPKKAILLAGTLVAAMVCGLAPSFPNDRLIFLALFGGLGTGCVLGISFALMAESEFPTKLCGKVMITAGLTLALVSILISSVLPIFNYKMGFPIAVVVLCALPLMLLVPGSKVRSAVAQTSADLAASLAFQVSFVFVVLILAGYVLNEVSRLMLWALVERRGQVIGFSTQQVGLVLGMTAIIGLGGAMTASILGLRFGRVFPLIMGLSLTALGMWGVMYYSSKGSFVAWRATWSLAENFYLPFYVGMIAAIDPRGRLNLVAVALGALGGSLGPSLGGLIVEATGYARDAAIVSCLIQVGIIGFVLPAAILLDRRARPKKAAATA